MPGAQAQMKFQLTDQPHGPSVSLSEGVLDVLDRYRQRSAWKKESGGQLFARFAGVNTLVIEASIPNRLDIRSRFGFVPHQSTQNAQIRRQFAKGLHFVGDWHSHPEETPTPSPTDIRSMRECLIRSQHDLKALLLVIVGNRLGAEGLWVGLVSRTHVRRLHAIGLCRSSLFSGCSAKVL
jgi:integrative and conjugative element protein (TIGR02256 family)